MPYVSDAQRRFFNSPAGIKKIGAEKVEEFNQASKGKELPERKKKPAVVNYAAMVENARRYGS